MGHSDKSANNWSSNGADEGCRGKNSNRNSSVDWAKDAIAGQQRTGNNLDISYSASNPPTIPNGADAAKPPRNLQMKIVSRF